jgi:hypothetical protein
MELMVLTLSVEIIGVDKKLKIDALKVLLA